MVVDQRNRIGDFELDTVFGPCGHSKAVLLTLNCQIECNTTLKNIS